MTTITIPYDAAPQVVKRIKAHCRDAAINDVNFSGVNFRFVRGDFLTSTDERPEGVALYHEISDILHGLDGADAE